MPCGYLIFILGIIAFIALYFIGLRFKSIFLQTSILMEVSTYHQNSRKKRKKKKKSADENGVQAVVNPEWFDGVTNWSRLQQVLEKDKDPESSKSESKSRFSKSYKKKRGTKNSKNKNPSTKMKTVEEFKFDFDEGRASNSADTDINDNEVDTDDTTGLTKTVAIDCEMVGTGPEGKDSMLARVSIVNAFGNCLYDEFVKPKEKVTDYRTEVSGVRPADLKKGKDLYEVQKDVLTIIDGRRVVGHDLKHDFDVLFIGHPRSLIRDTARYKPFREVSNGRTPSLKKLAAVILNLDFQKGEHNSVQDAQVAMMLYLKHKKAWERSLKRNKKK